MSQLTQSQLHRIKRRKTYKKVYNIIHRNMATAQYRRFIPLTMGLAWKLRPLLEEQMRILQGMKITPLKRTDGAITVTSPTPNK